MISIFLIRESEKLASLRSKSFILVKVEISQGGGAGGLGSCEGELNAKFLICSHFLATCPKALGTHSIYSTG